MTQAAPPAALSRARAEFDELVRDIRPELHRYCARMTGSVVDGEDVVQDALAKAYYALPMMQSMSNLRGWLYRIAHNKAIDHLRRYERLHAEPLDDHAPAAEPDPPLAERELAALALAAFLELPPMQRSCVILMDVLGHSLAEISELLDASVPAIKAALHRGRASLRARPPDVDTPPALDAPELALLRRYVDRFNARDFDAVRGMLAADVRLDLIGRAQRRGAAQVGEYFHRYDEADDWRLAVGWVEGRPAILAYDTRTAGHEPVYFMLVSWQGGQVASIRDYRYARHVLRDATRHTPQRPGRDGDARP